jgi:hypothetical protein
LNRDVQRFAAAIGGAGFGTFIDEVGKFVTRNNDYFYQPSVAIMYLVLVVLGLAGRTLVRRRYTCDEYLLNALREMEELALHDMDARERGRTEELLRESDATNPLVVPLQEVLRQAPLVPSSRSTPYLEMRAWLRERYLSLVRQPRFRAALAGFFVLQLTFKIVYAILIVFFPWVLPSPDGGPPLGVTQRLAGFTYSEIGQLATTLLSGLFIAIGVRRLAAVAPLRLPHVHERHPGDDPADAGISVL